MNCGKRRIWWIGPSKSSLKGNHIANGMTFESGNAEDLTSKIEEMWSASFDYEKIAMEAVARYSSEAYYEKLMEIYRHS